MSLPHPELTGVSSRRVRAFVVALVLVGVVAAIARDWETVFADASGPARTPLYPSFVDALGGEPLLVARAQKVLAALGLMALVVELTAGLNAWLVGALVAAGAAADLLRSGPGALHSDVSLIGPSGLDPALVLVFLAATFAYLRAPTARKGAIIALVLSLLVSNHPQNAVLAAVFVVIFVVHLGRGETWQQAALTTLGLVVVFAVPLVVHAVEGRVRDVSARLVARNALAYGKLALASTHGVWHWTVHGPALAAALVAGVLYARGRSYELLFVVFFAAVPLLALLFASVAGAVLAEALGFPLLAVTVWTLRTPSSPCPSPS